MKPREFKTVQYCEGITMYFIGKEGNIGVCGALF